MSTVIEKPKTLFNKSSKIIFLSPVSFRTWSIRTPTDHPANFQIPSQSKGASPSQHQHNGKEQSLHEIKHLTCLTPSEDCDVHCITPHSHSQDLTMQITICRMSEWMGGFIFYYYLSPPIWSTPRSHPILICCIKCHQSLALADVYWGPLHCDVLVQKAHTFSDSAPSQPVPVPEALANQ